MSGKELFEKYTSEYSEYSKMLMWMYTNVGEGLFPLLEEAESEGKKLDVRVMDVPYLVDEISVDDIILI